MSSVANPSRPMSPAGRLVFGAGLALARAVAGTPSPAADRAMRRDPEFPDVETSHDGPPCLRCSQRSALTMTGANAVCRFCGFVFSVVRR